MLINYYEGNRLPFFLLRSSSIFIGTFIALVLKQIQIFIKGNVILNMKCSMYLLIIKSLTQIYQNGNFYIIQFCFKITENNHEKNHCFPLCFYKCAFGLKYKMALCQGICRQRRYIFKPKVSKNFVLVECPLLLSFIKYFHFLRYIIN